MADDISSFHDLSVEDSLLKLNSKKNGLSTEEATKRQEIYGKNEIKAKKIDP
jgi:magnesium-transporting ATPase (P-type)